MQRPEERERERQQMAEDLLNWAGGTRGSSESLLLARLIVTLESIDGHLRMIAPTSRPLS
jgi:hypothetical protein